MTDASVRTYPPAVFFWDLNTIPEGKKSLAREGEWGTKQINKTLCSFLNLGAERGKLHSDNKISYTPSWPKRAPIQTVHVCRYIAGVVDTCLFIVGRQQTSLPSGSSILLSFWG